MMEDNNVISRNPRRAKVAVPIKERYFEDYIVGEQLTYGDYLITAQEIHDFATRYDPQSFHLDEEAARQSIYGGIIASGWMTGSIMMRLMADHFISPRASMGSPGVDELRWQIPVRAGDRLKVRVTTVSARRSKSKPDRGIIQATHEGLNQKDELVMSYKAMGMYLCRP
jgi:acyl dehydratase